MDKETLSHYGWIVILVLILAVLLALASPFGMFIADGIKATTAGLWDTQWGAMSAVGIILPNEEFVGEPAPCNIEGHYLGDGRGEHMIPVTDCHSNHQYTCECDGWTVPENGTYIILYQGGSDERTFHAGEKLPCGYESQLGDVFTLNEYHYRFNQYQDSGWGWVSNITQNGWGVECTDKSVVAPGAFLSEINGKPVNNARSIFYNCKSLKKIPEIPSCITDMSWAFYSCESLDVMPDLRNCTQLKSLACAFQHCISLVDVSDFYIPESVTNLNLTFYYCKNLKKAPDFSHLVNLTSMISTFESCEKLEEAPNLSNCTKLTTMNSCFLDCTSLKTIPVVNESVTDAKHAFHNCSSLVGTIKLPCKQDYSFNSYYNCPADIVFYHVGTCDGTCGK